MRYIQDRETGELIPADEYYATHEKSTAVMGDIPAYRSMITGEIIEGRKAHREHLKRHNCVEVGNDAPTRNTTKQDNRLKEQIARQVYSKLRY